MNRLFFSLLFCLLLAGSTLSCTRCKKCHTESVGVKSAEQEYCGDQLKQVEKAPGIVCE